MAENKLLIYRFFWRFLVLHAAFILVVQGGHYGEIFKRELRWNNVNRAIVSDLGSSLRIDYLKPHPKNAKVLDKHDYMAFTVYKADGHTVPPSTGIFHFIDSSKADAMRANCARPTMHAGAYYYFYGKCPEQESELVASGYCFQGSNGRGLVYNSLTFNSKFMSYLDGHYYLDNNREVNSFEQGLISRCFSAWKSAGFPVTSSWSCDLSKLPVSSKQVATPQMSVSGQCTGCDCVPPRKSSYRG